MKTRLCTAALLCLILAIMAILVVPRPPVAASHDDDRGANPSDVATALNAKQMIEAGQKTFRFDTFGDEAFWGDALQLHRAIAGGRFGGVGPGLSPKQALELGLKVDADALPDDFCDRLRAGRVNLDDPANTLFLLRRNVVVGVTGFFDPRGTLKSVGIQCALCHSMVDNSCVAGVGRRLDGWANRDLNVGEVVALAPNLKPFADLLGVSENDVRKVLRSWGPGKFDAELILDGKAFRPDGESAATLIPPAFGLAGVNLHTWTGWGSVTHWNAFVANLEMHGKGTFFDPRLNDATKFPIAAKAGFGNVRNTPDLITGKLAALHFYQLAIPAPRPPAGSFDEQAAARGKVLFNGKARCATCHVPPLFTEPGWNMHTPAEIGIDDFQAKRSPDERYRTAPLKGLWTHTKGGFYHDGRFANLLDVINHYNTFFNLGLTAGEKVALVQYLKSL
jgi:mono/diheme cytochrome c family protein